MKKRREAWFGPNAPNTGVKAKSAALGADNHFLIEFMLEPDAFAFHSEDEAHIKKVSKEGDGPGVTSTKIVYQRKAVPMRSKEAMKLLYRLNDYPIDGEINPVLTESVPPTKPYIRKLYDQARSDSRITKLVSHSLFDNVQLESPSVSSI